ncbi:MAG: response regulator transcription factor [Chromatiales bacterium]|nr:response regulator transcription factor [Chromatiales bacterium]
MKILHMDDHSVFAQALAPLLKQEWPHDEVLIATRTEDARALLRDHRDIGLILLDLDMPDGSGAHLLSFLRAERRPVPVVVLTAETRTAEIKRVIDLGAIAYIPKSYTSTELLAALRRVMSGEPSFPDGFEREISRLSQVGQAGENRLAVAGRFALSLKQLDVLELMADGLSNAEIAERLGISDNAVKYHLKILFQSFEVTNRVQCVAYARSVKLLPE